MSTEVFKKIKNDFENLLQETQFKRASVLDFEKELEAYLLSYQKVINNYDQTNESRIEADEQKIVVENIKNTLTNLFKSRDAEFNLITTEIKLAKTIIRSLNNSFENINKETTNQDVEKNASHIQHNLKRLEGLLKKIKKNKRKVKDSESAIYDLRKKTNLYTYDNRKLDFEFKNNQANTSFFNSIFTRNKLNEKIKHDNEFKETYLNQIFEATDWKMDVNMTQFESDTESCYSDHEQNVDTDLKDKKSLNIIIEQQNDKAAEELILRGHKAQKKFLEKEGFIIEHVVVPVQKSLNRNGLNTELQDKLQWVTKADQFTINVTNHGMDIDKDPENDPKNVVKLLMLHGLNASDYKQKGTINFQSCESGVWSLQRAANELKLYGINGLKLKGSNHLLAINEKEISADKTDKPLNKRKHHAAQLGEELACFSNGRYGRANAKTIDGKYKYINHVVVPPKKETQKKNKRTRRRSP